VDCQKCPRIYVIKQGNIMDKDRALDKAKISFMLKPDSTFLTSLLFSTNMVWDDSIKTAATNGLNMWINPTFFMSLTPEERIFLLAHECWHVALNHMFRGEKLNQEKYNKAADYVINLMLSNSGFTMIQGGLIDTQYADMSTEQVYKLLPDEEEKNDGGNGGDTKGDYDCDIVPQDSKSKDFEENKCKVESAIIRAATQSKLKNEACGNDNSEMAKIFDNLINPVLPWDVILQNYMSTYAKEDFSFRKPNKRFMPEYYLPSLYSESLDKITVAIDASGSVSKKEYAMFLSEVIGLKESLNPQLMEIMNFQRKITEHYKFTEDEKITDVVFNGGGGTSLFPVFELCKKEPPLVLLVFSDLHCRPIEEHPGYDVIWIVVNNPDAEVNFGETIHYATS
jgi:predicted metal-dependent peptidase